MLAFSGEQKANLTGSTQLVLTLCSFPNPNRIRGNENTSTRCPE
ncbi:hypothetical protein AS9A_4131 [Hoyosella subflava DQS3-9A1]|uniref:Uncharacterized protein n=1 Tax=Hoyosella subflava (strain DSM 45089 / JCM 17490 / NBRC 109087 / DQS3-9A1) TaxID=443218 RepID=F6EJE9_HOYSD|nr:hypothetical protein AS9A_4131 [Hoyosella subflava DQS3-9A1]